MPSSERAFCPIPFLQLQLTTHGAVSCCCYSDEYPVGRAEDGSIEKIWNGEKIRAWRKEFLTGEIQICKKPMETFGCHEFYQHLNSQVEKTEWQKQMPRKLDLRFSGLCNLKCVMCNVWQDTKRPYDQTDFWERGPTDIFPHLLEVDMLGGEPFMQKDTFRLIRQVRDVNSQCTWGFVTNAHYRLTEKLKQILESISLRHIHLSLDSVVPETYEKIRVGGRWPVVGKCVEDFVDFRKACKKQGSGFTLMASMCVQRDNWHEVRRFLNFCREREIQPILQNVINRADLALDSLPETTRKSMVRDWRGWPAEDRDLARPIFSPLVADSSFTAPG